MSLFTGLAEADEESDIEDLSDVTVTAPADMKPEFQAAFKDLEKAMSHLLRGNYRACVQHAGDAVNQIGIAADINAYASY